MQAVAPTKAPVVEDVEDVNDSEGTAKRGRGAAPDKNYGTLFNNDSEAKSNPPMKDGSSVEGFRIYCIANQVDKADFESDDDAKKIAATKCFVWARNQQQALAFYGESLFLVDTLERKTRTTKIDPIYIRYIGMALFTDSYTGLDTIFADDDRYYQYVVEQAAIPDSEETKDRIAKQNQFQKFLNSAEAKNYVASKVKKAA